MHALSPTFRLYLTVCFLALVASGCVGTSGGGGSPVPVWGRWEQDFEASAAVANSDDLVLKVHLTSPGGEMRTVDGFWDGGNRWSVRFMPDEAGTWRYRTEARPQVAGLHGQTGSFRAAPAQGSANPFVRHGAIRVSDNGRHLVHADGTPFFWMGDTAWNGAIRSTEADWAAYLRQRDSLGYNAIQLVTTQWRTAYANPEGEVAYTGSEDIRINPAFFDRIDARMDAVNEAGLLAAPVLLWGLGEPEYTPGKLPESQAVKLARYLVARYQGHHVLWFLAGDDNFSGENGARWRRIGRAVFDAPHHAPVTIHPQGRQWFFDDFAGEDWLDVLIYQSSHGGDARTLSFIHSGPPAQKWRQEPVRPVINSEPGYEDHVAHGRGSGVVHNAFDVRQQVYYSLLVSPTAGITYGGHGIWSWETEPAVPLNHDNTGVAKPWHEAVRLPGSLQMKHAADFFNAMEWWRLVPDPSLLQSQPGTDDPTRFVAAARSEAGDLAVLYLPHGGTVSLNTSSLQPALTATWFNPRAGSRLPANTTGPSYTAPDGNDWVLVLSAGR